MEDIILAILQATFECLFELFFQWIFWLFDGKPPSSGT